VWGTDHTKTAGKEDPVELDSMCEIVKRNEKCSVGGRRKPQLKHLHFHILFAYEMKKDCTAAPLSGDAARAYFNL